MYISKYIWNFLFFSCLYPFSVGDASLCTLIFLLMFTIGGSAGVSLGNAVVDIALRDTCYVLLILILLSLGAVIAILSGIMYYRGNTRKAYIHFGDRSISVCYGFFGILLTFPPMRSLCRTAIPSRISDFPNYFNSGPSTGSGITFISWLFWMNNRAGNRLAFKYNRVIRMVT